MDLGQAPDIELSPDLQVDLSVYQFDETDFLDSETGEFTPVIRDTVRLEFLNDTYIQDGLVFAEFRFKHENKFPQPIKSNIKFLDKNNRLQFNVSYTIPAGSQTNPAVIDTVYRVEDSDIGKVKKTIPMVMELEMTEGKDIKGELDFYSKGRFKFEF